jgi:hypothetical protein
MSTFDSQAPREAEDDSIKAEIEEVAREVSNYFDATGDPKEPGGRQLACGVASDIYYYLLSDVAQRKEVGIDHLKIVNIWMIYLAGQGLSSEQISAVRDEYLQALQSDEAGEDELRAKNLMTDVLSHTFQHAVILFRRNKKWFIGDETICQFVDKETGEITDGYMKSTLTAANPQVRELYERGMLELSPENLRVVFDLITHPSRRDLIKEINAQNIDEILQAVPALMPDHSAEHVKAKLLAIKR